MKSCSNGHIEICWHPIDGDHCPLCAVLNQKTSVEIELGRRERQLASLKKSMSLKSQKQI